MFFIYAIQEDKTRYDSVNGLYGRKLLTLQIVYDVRLQGWLQPSLKELELPLNQCASVIEVSEALIVLTCKETQLMSIYRRKTHEVLFEKSFAEQGASYGD